MTQPSTFEVIPLGVGNYFSTLRFHTSVVLHAGDGMILVDCPEPLFRMCASAADKSRRPIDLEKIDHIVLTHLHGDHCNGLEGLGFWRKFHRPASRRPTLYTTPPVADLLWKKLSVAMGEAFYPVENRSERYELADFFNVVVFDFGESFSAGGLEFQTRRTLHSLPCFGFRASCNGRVFGYSSDTQFDPEHIAFLEPAHLIFHETDDGMHTPLEKLEALPGAIRAKMRLIHLNNEFAGSAKIQAAEEGGVYPV